MAVNATQLLRQLEPAVRPSGMAATSPAKFTGALEVQSFDQLLSLASKGAMPSGRQIDVGLELDPPLAPSQLERLAAAADVAEAAGASRALMLIDGRGFVLDVHSRTLVAELSGAAAANVFNVDAAVFVGDGDDSSPMSVKAPGNGTVPPGVSKVLMHSAKPQAFS